jgi:hypothetical protein
VGKGLPKTRRKKEIAGLLPRCLFVDVFLAGIAFLIAPLLQGFTKKLIAPSFHLFLQDSCPSSPLSWSRDPPFCELAGRSAPAKIWANTCPITVDIPLLAY